VNNGRDTTRQSFHYLHGVGAKSASEVGSKLGSNHAYVPGFDYALAFHVFSVEWTPERVRHFVDGVMIADREYRFQHDDGSDGGAAHVLVNLAVGGDWPGSPTSVSSFPISLEIDYVRVWQR
jgi:beta-glucanase (GH16 family)